MALLKHYREIDVLAQELSQQTGESATQATIIALRERLARVQAKRQRPASVKQDLLRIGRECAALPLIDARPAEEIIGYNEGGLLFLRARQVAR